MTISRSRLVDATVSRCYHCISRCVRRAHLMGDEAAPGRKDWIENRLKELDQIFAVSVGGFSLMDNHLLVSATWSGWRVRVSDCRRWVGL